MQSVYKFPIGIAILHAVEQGQLTLSEPVLFLPSDAVLTGQHSPLRDRHPRGGVTVPLLELLRLAVSESDGTASDILLRILGGPVVVDRYIRSLGVQGIAVVDTEKTLGKDGKAQYRDDSTLAASQRHELDAQMLDLLRGSSHHRVISFWTHLPPSGLHQ